MEQWRGRNGGVYHGGDIYGDSAIGRGWLGMRYGVRFKHKQEEEEEEEGAQEV